MHDTDKPTEPVTMAQTPVLFSHPQGFQIGTVLAIAIDPKGPCFINIPPDPSMALHLLNELTQYIVKNSIRVIEGSKKQSSLIVAPAGSLPPWDGPAGRG